MAGGLTSLSSLGDASTKSAVSVDFPAGAATLAPVAASQIASAASEYRYFDRPVRLRLSAPREHADADLWRARVLAVRDALLRAGVPANLTFAEGGADDPVTIVLLPKQYVIDKPGAMEFP